MSFKVLEILDQVYTENRLVPSFLEKFHFEIARGCCLTARALRTSERTPKQTSARTLSTHTRLHLHTHIQSHLNAFDIKSNDKRNWQGNDCLSINLDIIEWKKKFFQTIVLTSPPSSSDDYTSEHHRPE